MRQPSLPNLCKGFAGHIHTHEIEEKCLSVCVKDDSFTKKWGRLTSPPTINIRDENHGTIGLTVVMIQSCMIP